MSCWEQDNHGLCGWFFGVLPIYVWGLCPLLSRLLGRLPPARLTLESQDQSLLQDLQLVIPHISLLPCASASSLEFAVGVRCPWWQGKVERVAVLRAGGTQPLGCSQGCFAGPWQAVELSRADLARRGSWKLRVKLWPAGL